LIPSAVFDLF